MKRNVRAGSKPNREARTEERRLDRAGGAGPAHIVAKLCMADGAIVFAKACELGLEGIGRNEPESRYWSGRTRKWVKVKNPAFQRNPV